MQKTERLAVVLTPAEKSAVVEMAEAEGGLTQAALVRRLIRDAARQRGLWPPEHPRCSGLNAQEVQHG